jgi:hypothetical protein
MATTFKNLYPSTSTSALTITLASLADDTTNKIAGRASTAVNNTTDLDIDHLVSGKITVGTSPTANGTIEVWCYAMNSESAGTPTYPDSITGTDAAKTMTSLNVKYSAMRIIQGLTVDNTTGRAYYFGPTSVAMLFGGMLPPFWGVMVINASGVALDATGGNHSIQYTRVQQQGI